MPFPPGNHQLFVEIAPEIPATSLHARR